MLCINTNLYMSFLKLLGAKYTGHFIRLCLGFLQYIPCPCALFVYANKSVYKHTVMHVEYVDMHTHVGLRVYTDMYIVEKASSYTR